MSIEARPLASATPQRSSQARAYEIVALVLILSLTAVAIVSLIRPQAVTMAHANMLQAVMTTASVVIALGACYFAADEFLLYRRITALWVALAFLSFAGANVLLGLVPLLLRGHRSAGTLGFGWALESLYGGFMLLVAGLCVRRSVRSAQRLRLLVLSVSPAALPLAAFSFLVFGRPPGVPGVHVQTAIYLLSGTLFFASSLLFWRAAKNQERRWFVWLSMSLAVAGFAAWHFALYPYRVGVVVPGESLSLVFYAAILLALTGEWSHDHRSLRWQARDLAALQSLATPPVVPGREAVVLHIARVVEETMQGKARVLLAADEESGMRDPLTEQLVHLALSSRISNDERDAQNVVMGVEEGEYMRAALGVVLKTSHDRIGMLVVTREAGHEFSVNDVRLMRALGTQASLLLERSFLHEEVAAGAILEERARLAREIHDGLAQYIAFLKMRVAWMRKKPEDIDVAQLADIEHVLETALAEARNAITTLRIEPGGASITEILASYAQEFGNMSGLDVAIQQADTIPDVSPGVRVELLRIVQEALSNVRKHAQASNVWLNIGSVNEGMQVQVRDDGVGFDGDVPEPGHYGISIMQERARSVGGTVDVSSCDDGGTQVRIWMPRQHANVPPETDRGSGHAGPGLTTPGLDR